jgi:ATP-dependent helicase HrpB
VHPRLAHMLIRGKELGLGSIACDVAALLDDYNFYRDFKDNDIDLSSRWIIFKEGKGIDYFYRERITTQSKRLRKLLNVEEEKSNSKSLGILLALIYPERVAKKRVEKYQLSGNTIGVLPKASLLSREEYLAIGDVDGIGSEVKIFLAEPISEEEIRKIFADQIEEKEKIFWDEKQEYVAAKIVQCFGAIELSEKNITPDDATILKLLIDVIHSSEMKILPWNTAALHFQKRSEFVRLNSFVGKDWPNLSNSYLLENLSQWLAPFLNGIVRRSQLRKLDLEIIFHSFYTYEQLQILEKLAPTHHRVPTGSRIPIDYSTSPPVFAVRLQELFGETETPTIGGGTVPLLLHLLSPAHRPLAVTQDLKSFWNNAYVDVRKDMRGQYPKHYWPENPIEALPTKRTKQFRKD